MNTRHRRHLSTPLMTQIEALVGYLADKAVQARKFVQVNNINPILAKANTLFYLGLDLLDGQNTVAKMQECLYKIQAGAYLVNYLEECEVRKRLSQNVGAADKPKKRKHYGFDDHATAHIDLMCDELLRLVSSYGQKSYTRKGEAL